MNLRETLLVEVRRRESLCSVRCKIIYSRLSLIALGVGVASLESEQVALAAHEVRRLELDLCLVGVSRRKRVVVQLLHVLRIDPLFLFGQGLRRLFDGSPGHGRRGSSI